MMEQEEGFLLMESPTKYIYMNDVEFNFLIMSLEKLMEFLCINYRS